MVSCPGTTWEYWEDHLTVPILLALSDYWADHPPLHTMIAQFLGHKPKNKPVQVEEQPEDISNLMRMFPTGLPPNFNP